MVREIFAARTARQVSGRIIGIRKHKDFAFIDIRDCSSQKIVQVLSPRAAVSNLRKLSSVSLSVEENATNELWLKKIDFISMPSYVIFPSYRLGARLE